MVSPAGDAGQQLLLQPASPSRSTGSTPSARVARAGIRAACLPTSVSSAAVGQHAQVIAAKLGRQRERQQPGLGQFLPEAGVKVSGRGAVWCGRAACSAALASAGLASAGRRRVRGQHLRGEPGDLDLGLAAGEVHLARLLPGQAEQPFGHQRQQDLGGAAGDAQAPGQQELVHAAPRPRRRQRRRPDRQAQAPPRQPPAGARRPASLRTAASGPGSAPRSWARTACRSSRDTAMPSATSAPSRWRAAGSAAAPSLAASVEQALDRLADR